MHACSQCQRSINSFLGNACAAGLREGIDEDDLVAKELGKDKIEELTDVQQQYKDKIKARLAQVRLVCNWMTACRP